MASSTTIDEKQMVVFTLGKETYGVDIGIVREIIQMQLITRIPGTSDSIEGVINLRGSVIPVVDLPKRFQLTKTERGKNTRIVVINCKKQDIGIIVDAVAEVLRISKDAIEPNAAIMDGTESQHVSGIAKLADRLIILLDMEQVLFGDKSSSVAREISTIESVTSKTQVADARTTKEPVLAK